MPHTPGPWSIRHRSKIIRVEAPHAGGVNTIICEIENEDPAAVPDARLIAAAPEMAALLRKVDWEAIQSGVFWDEARALLARIPCGRP